MSEIPSPQPSKGTPPHTRGVINILIIAFGLSLSICGFVYLSGIMITGKVIAALMIVLGIVLLLAGAMITIPSAKGPRAPKSISYLKIPKPQPNILHGSKSKPFPLAARSILAMCWGLTMNLSHEPQQVAMGKTFTDKFLDIFKEVGQNQVHKEFMQNLLMELNGTVRSIGFIRANHVSYLDYQSDRLTRKRRNLEQIGDIGSFSGSGLYAKIGSFIGFGSLVDLVKGLSLPQIDVMLFAVAGIAGVVIVTFIVQRYVLWSADSWEKEIMKNQSKYWKEEFKPDVTVQLFYFFCQVRAVIREYYSNADVIIAQDELLSRTQDDEVKRIISDEILPPDDLLWAPYIIPDAQKSTAGSEAKPQGEGKGGEKSPKKA